ncbi:MAG: AraC family transcriptional regulator [Bacillota bacterium]
MEAWESIQKSLDYIENNLSERMEINVLSAHAGLSPFYFQRLFSRLVGRPVMEYIKLRRLAKASEFIINEKNRIIDIAISAGFDNHETFTRAFKDNYDITPEAFRKNPRPLTHYFKPDLSMQYYLIDENIPLAADGIILEICRKVLDKPRNFAGVSIDMQFPNNPGIDYLAELWGSFHDKKASIGNLKADGNEIGVGGPSDTEGCIKYFAGAEVTAYDNLDDFRKWTMPEGNYVVCSFEAENFYLLTTNALDKAVQYMYRTWLPKKDILTEPFLSELYYNTGSDTSYMELWFKISNSQQPGL